MLVSQRFANKHPEVLSLRQFIGRQTPADVERIFAKAGVKVRDGAMYDATTDKVIEIHRVRDRLDWLENEGEGQ